MKTTSQIFREDLLNTPSHQRGTGQGTPTLQPPLPGLDTIVKPFRFAASPYLYKVVSLREARTPEQMTLCDTPAAAAAYWRLHVPKAEAFDPECECFTVLLLNTRRRIKAHHLVSVGTHDTLLVHPLQVFRLAIMTSAAALNHQPSALNHSSGGVSHLLRSPGRGFFLLSPAVALAKEDREPRPPIPIGKPCYGPDPFHEPKGSSPHRPRNFRCATARDFVATTAAAILKQATSRLTPSNLVV